MEITQDILVIFDSFTKMSPKQFSVVVTNEQLS